MNEQGTTARGTGDVRRWTSSGIGAVGWVSFAGHIWTKNERGGACKKRNQEHYRYHIDHKGYFT